MRLFLLVATAVVIALAGGLAAFMPSDTTLTAEVRATDTHSAGNTTAYRVAAPQTFEVERHVIEVPYKISEGGVSAEQDLHLRSPIQSAEADILDEIEVRQWSFRGDSLRPAAFDSDGNIFGIGEYEVSRIDTDNDRQTTWTMPEDWYTYNYDGFAHGSEFYFHSHGNLSKLDPETGVFTTWNVALNNNPSIVDGDLYFDYGHYVTDLSDYAFLAKFNPDNSTLTHFASDIPGDPYTRLHHGDSSGLYFAVYFDDESQNGIIKFVPDDGTITYWSGIPDVGQIVVSGEKAYWEHRERRATNIVQFDMEAGIVTKLIVPDTCDRIYDIVVDSSGTVFFTCYYDNFYKLVPSAGTFTRFYTYPAFYNLEIDSSDTIYWDNNWHSAGTIRFIPPEPPVPHVGIYWGERSNTVDGAHIFAYYVVFDKAVTGFDSDDIDNIVVSGTAGAVLNTTRAFVYGSSAEFRVHASDSGTITVTIPENIVTDERGVGNVRGTHTITASPPEVVDAILDEAKTTIVITTSGNLTDDGDYNAWRVSGGNTTYYIDDTRLESYPSEIIMLELENPVPAEVTAIYVTHSRDVAGEDPRYVDLAEDLLGFELVIENLCIDTRAAKDGPACRADGELN